MLSIFSYYWPSIYFSIEKCHLDPNPFCFTGYFGFLLLSCMSSIYIFWILTPYQVCNFQIFFHLVGCPLILLMVFFAVDGFLFDIIPLVLLPLLLKSNLKNHNEIWLYLLDWTKLQNQMLVSTEILKLYILLVEKKNWSFCKSLAFS